MGTQVPLRAEALNFDGTVLVGGTGGASQTTAPKQPFRWRLGAGLELIPAATAARFVDCSDDGDVCVGVLADPLIPYYNETVRWSPGGSLQPIGFGRTDANAVSGDGQHIVGGSGSGPNSYQGFVFRPAGFLELLDTGSFSAGSALAVSRDGTVVAGALFEPYEPSASFFLRKQQGPIIEVPAQGSSIQVSDISADGRVVVGLQTTDSTVFEPFVWEDGVGFIDMGPLPLNGTQGRATGVSADGQFVVGFYFDTAIFGNEPFIWSASLGSIVKLDDYLATLGFSFADPDRSSLAVGISGDGNAILGADQGIGEPKSWIVYLTPPSAAVRSESVCGPASVNSSGSTAAIAAVGTAIIGLNDTLLAAQGLPAGQLTLIVGSNTLDPMPLGNGTLCVGGSVGTFNALAANSSASGEITVPLDLTALPTPMGARPAMAGEAWFFQAMFRDPVGPSFFNLSDAARVVFY